MPQIPQYFSQTPISTESTNALAPQWLADDISAPNKILGAALENIRKDFEATQIQRQETQDMLDLAIADNALTDQTLKLQEEFKNILDKGVDEEGNHIDYQKTLTDYRAKHDELVDSVMASPTYNSRVKAALMKSAGNERQKALGKAYELVDKYQVRDQQETWSDNFNQHLAKGEWGKAVADINGGFQGRLLTFEQKRANEKLVFSTMVQANINNLEAEVGPEKAYKILADPKVKEELLAIKDDKGNVLYRIPETIYDKEVTDLRQKNNLIKKEREETEKEAYNQVANNIFSQMVSGNITSANIGELNKQIDALPIKGTQKIDLSNKVKAFVDNSDPFSKTENIQLLNEHKTRALMRDSTLTIEEVYKNIGPGGYSSKDGLDIIAKIASPENSREDKLIQYADNYLVKAITPTGQFGESLFKDEEINERQQALYYARSILQQKIREETGKGKSMDDVLMPRINENGIQVNQNFILDDIVRMFMPGGKMKLPSPETKTAEPNIEKGESSNKEKEEWIKREMPLNPAYTEQELSDYYDKYKANK